MDKAILVAIVYTIIADIEILAYYISKNDSIYFYGFITLVTFIFTFGSMLYYTGIKNQ